MAFWPTLLGAWSTRYSLFSDPPPVSYCGFRRAPVSPSQCSTFCIGCQFSNERLLSYGVLAYKCIHQQAPIYLARMCVDVATNPALATHRSCRQHENCWASWLLLRLPQIMEHSTIVSHWPITYLVGVPEPS